MSKRLNARLHRNLSFRMETSYQLCFGAMQLLREHPMRISMHKDGPSIATTTHEDHIDKAVHLIDVPSNCDDY